MKDATLLRTEHRLIPIGALAIAAANARHIASTNGALVELTASIAHRGLIEPMVVRPAEPDESGAERYDVVAGGRRLRALQAMVEAKELSPETEVFCQVRSDIASDEDALDVSLSENFVREAMHPADEIRAFARLVEGDTSTAEIARRYGRTEHYVRQRLALAGVAPVVFEAFATDEIGVQALRAYARSGSQAAQAETFEALKIYNDQNSAWAIGNALDQRTMRISDPRVRFVGLKAYRAAGGAITEDLFAGVDEHTEVEILDRELLERLATEKLAAAAKEVEGEWAWVETFTGTNYWSAAGQFAQVTTSKRPPAADTDPKRKKAAVKAAESLTTLRAAEDRNANRAQGAQARVVKAHWAHMRLELAAARATLSKAQGEVAGLLLYLSEDGFIRGRAGLLRPGVEDPRETARRARAAKAAGTTNGAAAPNGTASTGVPTTGHGNKHRNGYTMELAETLRRMRLPLVRHAIGSDYEGAFDLMTMHMAESLFGKSTQYRTMLNVSLRDSDKSAGYQFARDNEQYFASHVPGQAAEATLAESLSLEWLKIKDRGERFEAFCALGQADKEAIFAVCVAKTVAIQLSSDDGAHVEIEQVLARRDVDFAATTSTHDCALWTAEKVFKSMRKDRLLAIGRECLGEVWARQHASAKKAELALSLETAFSPATGEVDGVTKAARRRALRWLPPGFSPVARDWPEQGEATDNEEPSTAETGNTAPADAQAPETAPADGEAPDATRTEAEADAQAPAGEGSDAPPTAPPGTNGAALPGFIDQATA